MQPSRGLLLTFIGLTGLFSIDQVGGEEGSRTIVGGRGRGQNRGGGREDHFGNTEEDEEEAEVLTPTYSPTFFQRLLAQQDGHIHSPLSHQFDWHQLSAAPLATLGDRRGHKYDKVEMWPPSPRESRPLPLTSLDSEGLPTSAPFVSYGEGNNMYRAKRRYGKRISGLGGDGDGGAVLSLEGAKLPKDLNKLRKAISVWDTRLSKFAEKYANRPEQLDGHPAWNRLVRVRNSLKGLLNKSQFHSLDQTRMRRRRRK